MREIPVGSTEPLSSIVSSSSKLSSKPSPIEEAAARGGAEAEGVGEVADGCTGEGGTTPATAPKSPDSNSSSSSSKSLMLIAVVVGAGAGRCEVAGGGGGVAVGVEREEVVTGGAEGVPAPFTFV